MSNKDANVAVVVNGDTSQLRSDLKRGAKSLESFEDKAKRMQKQLLKVTTAGVAAGAALTGALYKQQSAIIDRLAKTADALGVTTQNLQALRHMGELAGVAAEDLDKAMQRMAKGLGDAARKGGAAADALDDVGVNIDDVLSLSADKQMELLAKALANVENHTEKASIASDLFGRNGLRMLKVLNQLEDEGLKPTIDSIEAMGAALSRVDAQAVEDANDAVAKAQEAASGLAKELTVELAPIVEQVANAFTDWVKESGGLRNKLEELKPVFNALVNIGKVMVSIYGAQLVSSMVSFSSSTAKAVITTTALERRLVVASIAANTMKKAVVGLNRAMTFLGGPVGLITLAASALFMFGSKSKDTANESDLLNDELERMATNFDKITQAGAKVALLEIDKPIREAAKNVASAQTEYDAELRRFESVNSSYLDSMEVFNTYLSAGYQQEAIVHGERAEKIKATLPEYQAALDRANLALENAIAEEKRLLEEKARLKDVASGKTESEAQAKSQQERMESMKAANDALVAEQIKHNAEMIEAIDTEAMAQKYAGYYERRQEAQKEHNDKMLEDHKNALDAMNEVEKLSWQERTMLSVGFASQMFGNISSLMDKENKKQFKIAKAANIAQATMDGITAAVGAFKVGNQIGGPIVGGAFAAASAATSAAMISQISSQQFNSGAQTANVSASTPATPQGANAGQTLTVQGLDSGALFDGNAVSDLADRLLDFQRDGGRVVLGA